MNAPRAEATLAGAEDGLLETALVDGVVRVELEVTGAGWVLLDAITYDEEGDIALTVLDADGDIVDRADAGYTYDDAVALAALWSTDVADTKAQAGGLLLDGQTLPVAPGSSVPADTES